MNSYALQLLSDRLSEDGEISPSLPPENRVVYVVEGNVTITADKGERELGQNSTWLGVDSFSLKARAKGA